MRTWYVGLRRLAVVAGAVVALMGPASPASAHSYLVSSAPSDGAVVSTSPGQLQLRFSEAIEAGATHVDVVGSDGTAHHPTRIELISSPAKGSGSAGGPVLLVLDLPALHPDAYRVSWETVSSDDLHRTSGVFVFGLQHAVTAAGWHENPPALAESGLRWLLFLAFALALGGTLLARLYRPDADSAFAEPALRRSRELAVSGALASLLVSVVLLAQQLSVSGESTTALLDSSYGTRWLVRQGGLMLLVVALLLRVRLTSGHRWLRGLTGVAAALAAIGSALLGHAGAGESPSPTRVAADAAHLLAAATWSGTLLVAAVVVVPRLRTSGGEGVTARAALRRFLVPAGVCVGVMVVTGVYLSSNVIGSVDALLLTTYGQIMLAKVAVVVVASILALRNIGALHPVGMSVLARAVGGRGRGRAAGRPRHVVPEAVAAALVLALSALLTSGQPALEPQLVASAADSAQPVVDGASADLQETLELRPNLPGSNVVLVGVFDTRRPAPGPVRGVDVILTGADGRAGRPLALRSIADGRWTVPASLTASGAMRVQVVVHRQGLPDTAASYRWVVAGAPSLTHKAFVSTARLRQPLQVVAAGLAVLLVLLALTSWWVARRRSTDGTDDGSDDETPVLPPQRHGASLSAGRDAPD
jgi:copper transport protein